jgi:hypothetical protein
MLEALKALTIVSICVVVVGGLLWFITARDTEERKCANTCKPFTYTDCTSKTVTAIRRIRH